MKSQLTLRMPGQVPSSSNIHLIGICLTLITACSVFNEKSFFETDSLQRRNSRVAIRQESASQTKALRIYSSADTSDRRTFAEIYPKGNFRYSPAEGYSGEAERLLIDERSQERQHVKGSSRLLQSNNSSSTVEERDKSLKKTRVKEKELVPGRYSWLYLAGCGLIFLLIFVLRNFLNKV
jgi:hypothetical protein